MKKISVLGSTGSIGTQTLDVVREQKEFEVTALAAGSNIELLYQQIKEFEPKVAAVYHEEKAALLRERLKSEQIKTELLSGMDGLIACATEESSDIVVAAIVGMIGIRPVLEAIKKKKEIALANKETLVTAGHIIMPAAREYGVNILPVDSEHSAIFQCLSGHDAPWDNVLHRIYLTASGGSFRGKTKRELQDVTVEQTLKHPNWSMGKKITVDSATLVNKGLEVMEAKWLFGVDCSKIKVLIQPQSIIHSMIEFNDGAVLAQLGTPDMKLPIQYALTYPKRVARECDRLDFDTLSSITFSKPDHENFPALLLAYEVEGMGHGAPCVYNAANEWAVEKFLQGKIKYLEIYEKIRKSVCWWEKSGMVQMNFVNREPELAEVLAIEAAIRNHLETGVIK